jgi:Ca2+-transporting ATPase
MASACGCLITGSVLASLVLAQRWLAMEQERAVTISVLALAFAQLWHVFNMRDRGSCFASHDVTGNCMWGALLLCALLLPAAVYVPGLSEVLQLQRPSLSGWGLVLSLSLAPWAVGQILKEALP